MHRNVIYQWVAQGLIKPSKVNQAKVEAGVQAGKAQWFGFIKALLLFTAVVALAAGVIFFFAYNWDGMSRFVKFGLIQVGLLLSSIMYLKMAGDALLRQAMLLLIALLIGSWLALVGQTYQTGADPWQLFAFWALLILPLVVVSRFEVMWLLLYVLVNLGLSLYQQVNTSLFGLLFNQLTWLFSFIGLNALFLVVYETLAAEKFIIHWARLKHRWPAQVVAFCFLWLVLAVGLSALFDGGDNNALSAVVFILSSGSFYLYYRHVLLDRALLAFWCLMMIVMVVALLSALLFDNFDSFFFMLFIALVVIGLSVFAGRLLMSLKSIEEERS